MSLNKSTIDYLAQAKDAINRPGYTLNICTGCKHWDMPEICVLGKHCYAYNLVVNGRLKNAPSYPYGFEPTFHPERIRAYGGKPKLLFLNDMGDVGGDWNWRYVDVPGLYELPSSIAHQIVNFAILNPTHIILLLTKNPSWYRYAEWPANVWCGFTATNNEELYDRTSEVLKATQPGTYFWASLEPWLDDEAPNGIIHMGWTVLGGLSGPNARAVSDATRAWLRDDSIQATRFTKENAEILAAEECPREYPAAWRVE